MAIEVRQILVKSSVVPPKVEQKGLAHKERDLERMKAEILSECRRMVLDMMRSEGER